MVKLVPVFVDLDINNYHKHLPASIRLNIVYIIIKCVYVICPLSSHKFPTPIGSSNKGRGEGRERIAHWLELLPYMLRSQVPSPAVTTCLSEIVAVTTFVVEEPTGTP